MLGQRRIRRPEMSHGMADVFCLLGDHGTVTRGHHHWDRLYTGYVNVAV